MTGHDPKATAVPSQRRMLHVTGRAAGQTPVSWRLVAVIAVGVLCVDTLLVVAGVTGGFDRPLLDALRAPRGSAAAHLAAAFTGLGDTAPLLTILIVLGALATTAACRGWRLVLLPFSAATLSWLAAQALKLGISRPRPPTADWAVTAHGYAFPSGHATSSTAGYLVLAALAASALPSRRWRIVVLAAGVAVSFLVGLSRIVLGVHWPTDVIGGWALGLAVAGLVLRWASAATVEQ